MSETIETEQQINKIHDRFTDRCRNWVNLYKQPVYANHLVLRDRKDIAMQFVKQMAVPGSTILDAGCGGGVLALEAAQNGYQVTGVDISEAMIQLAKDEFEQANIDPDLYSLECCEFHELSESAADEFDGCVALGFLEYQTNEMKALSMFHSMIKPGGILVISGPAKRRLSNLFGWISPSGGLSINSYCVKRFSGLLEEAGFEVIGSRQHGFAHFTYLSWIPGKQKLEFGIHHFFTFLNRFLPLHHAGNDLVMLARKMESPKSNGSNV